MSLRDQLPLPKATVNLPGGGSATVRGISPDDVARIYHRHSGELAVLFDHFAGKMQANDGDTDALVGALTGTLLNEAPRLLAEIIAVAMDADTTSADFDEDVDHLLRFSAGVQTAALEAIAGLTFSSDMPPGKFFALVLKMMTAATRANLGPQAA